MGIIMDFEKSLIGKFTNYKPVCAHISAQEATKDKIYLNFKLYIKTIHLGLSRISKFLIANWIIVQSNQLTVRSRLRKA